MSIKVFQDNIFPRHVSDLINLMHMVVFKGTDGEEKWPTYLELKQKEYIALGLAQYYKCDHCVEHHLDAILKLKKSSEKSLSENVSSMILFLRIDTRTVSKYEKEDWIDAWHRFARNVSIETEDKAIPYLMGLAIGIARNDEFLIDLCGNEINRIFKERNIDVSSAIGELEAVVVFMKAAVSKNRVVDKVCKICQ